MITAVSKFKSIIYTLLALPIVIYLYLNVPTLTTSPPVTINSNVSIPAHLLDEATLDSELGLVITKKNTDTDNQWKRVVKSGALFDCFRPLGEYEFNTGHWVTPAVVTYRNMKGEHLFSFIVELFHSNHKGQLMFEGVLKENLTLDYSAEGMSTPLNYFTREPKFKSGDCIIPIHRKSSRVLALPTYNSSRYRSLLLSYYMDAVVPAITSFQDKEKREI